MKKTILFFVTIFFLYDGLCQKPVIQWTNIIGGSKDEKLNITTAGIIDETLNFIEQTKDSGYVVICRTFSKDGDALGNKAYSALITKIDKHGKKSWVKVLPDYSTIVTYSVNTQGILMEYIIDIKWKVPMYFLSFISNDGSVLWTKNNKQRYSFEDKMLQIDDTSYVMVSKNYSTLTYFNAKGEINYEKKINYQIGDNEFIGNTKIELTHNNGLYLAYGSYSNFSSYKTETYEYYSNIILINDKGETLWHKKKSGVFRDFFLTKTNEAFLVRKVWEGNTSINSLKNILVDKYNDKGINVLGDGLCAYQAIIANAEYNFSACLTNDDRLLSSNGTVVKLIDTTKNALIKTFEFFEKDRNRNIDVNIVQGRNGNFYLQTIAERERDKSGYIINKIKIFSFDQNGKVLWDKVLWNIKDGNVVSFYEIENDKFIIISKNDFEKNLALYTIAILDNTGQTISNIVFYGPTDSYKFIKRTLDGGFVIAGLIYDKDISITDYHGGSDIMFVKFGFEK